MKSLCFVLLRVPVVLLMLPIGLFAGCMKIVGEWGEWLEDTCQDASRSVTLALNPQAWQLLKKFKEERDTFERGQNFWKSEAERLQREAAKAANQADIAP